MKGANVKKWIKEHKVEIVTSAVLVGVGAFCGVNIIKKSDIKKSELPIYDCKDAIRYINKETSIIPEVIKDILASEEHYMVSVGIMSDSTFDELVLD